MLPNTHLILHNVAGIITSVMLFGLALFVFLNNPKSKSNIAFSSAMVAVFIFVVSHTIGANIHNPEISRMVFMFNLSIIFIGIFIAHSILLTVGKARERRMFLIAIYSIGLFLTAFFIIDQNSFLLPSVSKMYFPNYYNPGALNWLRIVFLYGIAVPYSIYELIRAYRHSSDDNERHQLKYFIIAMFIGFGFGFIPNLLVYNINVDPLLGIFLCSLFVFPILYGSVKYGLFNIKIIAKQAFLYGVGVGIVGGLISLVNYSNELIKIYFPQFPVWVTALISAILAVTIGALVFRRLRENDLLKYEFISIMTHKFRTPLTGIRWAAENLIRAKLPEADMTQVRYIQSENARLVEITNLLMGMSDIENKSFGYELKRGEMSPIVEETISAVINAAEEKNLRIMKNLEPNVFASFDRTRLKFVAQVLLENAIHYTPREGVIEISLRRQNNSAIFSVKDSGIGMDKDEVNRLFSKFYRGQKAKINDTEGMGVGLFISKEIVGKHHGKIWATSGGLNKGSVFYFSLPLIK